ncbi:hypothetical protein D3C79_1034740 [compost metagenome]
MLGRFEQLRQGAVFQLQLVGVYQAVEVAQVLRIAFMFMQGRGARQLNTTADQAGKDGRLSHAACSWSISAKCARAMR